MIITYWKGVFVVDHPENMTTVLKRAGFELHEPSLCKPDSRCKACRAKIGNRYWSNRVTAATRMRPYCNQVALRVMGDHLDKLTKSRAVTADIAIPTPPGLSFLPYQKAGVAFLIAHKDTLLADDMGLGKDQPLDAKILTPGGWTTMGKIKKGDLVVGSDGLSYQVKNVYPQGFRKVFRITFQDGASTECGANHLWEVNTLLRKNRGYSPKVLSTQQIMDIGLKEKNGNSRHFIRLAKPHNFPRKTLAIHPYVMGYLLGNGGLSQVSVHVTIPDRESTIRLSSLLPSNIILTKKSPIDYRVTTIEHRRGRRNPFLDQMRRLGLMEHLTHEKFIPHEYLWTNIQNRVALLQGLIDSDGHVRPKDGNIEYSSSSPQLAKDVQQLIWSLGGTAKIRPKKTKRRLSYRMSVILPNNIKPCLLERKLAHRRRRDKYPPCRSMVKIDFVGLKETQCITVSSPDGLYVTDDFILTHNTVQALGFINVLREQSIKSSNVLVLCPGTLTFNWRNEAAKWLHKPMEFVLPTSTSFKVPPRNNLFVIVNYEKITRDNPLTRSLRRVWDVLVCDEAQALKNPKSQRSLAVLHPTEGLMQRAHRCAFLTGTPLENYPKELWPIAAAICPAKFGDWWAFAERYCGLHREPGRGVVDTGSGNLGELQQRLRASFMIRRLKGDVLKELPPKRRQLIVLGDSKIDWSRDPAFARWKTLYETEYEAKLAAMEAAHTQIEYKTAAKSLDEFTGVAFQEMSEFRHKTALAKLPACIEYIDKILETDIEKLVIFAHHQDVIDQLVAHYGPTAVALHGRTKSSEREEIVRRFQEGDARIIIGGLKAAGIGLNLFAASTAVFIEVDWNPAVLTQAEDRLCRIGQKKMVHVIHLVLEGTLDINIVKRIVAKQNVIDKALNHLPEHGLKVPQQQQLPFG